MVKGISRQVILVEAPEPKMFEQAIFILRDGTPAVTDEALLKEANRLVRSAISDRKSKTTLSGPIWACGGALVMGIAWLLTAIL